MKRLLLAATIACAMTCFGQSTSSPSSSTPQNSTTSTDQQQPATTTPDQSTSNSTSTSSSSADQNSQSQATANPQSDQPQDQSSTSSTAAQSTTGHKGHHKGAAASGEKASGGSKTLTGCIESKDGQYWLKTAHGKYHLMSSQDLSAHVGHEVKATGTTSMGPAPGADNASAGSTEAASTSGKSAKKAGKNVRHLEVSDIQMVSEQCKMAGGKSSAGKKTGKKGADTTSNPS